MRYALALALLNEGPLRASEAVEQLDQAVHEVGDEPATWELLERGAAALRDDNPTEAAARYLRSLRFNAPDWTAKEVRRWVEGLIPGILRQLDSRAVTPLLKQPTTPSRQLLAATLLRSLGDSQAAYDAVRDIDLSSKEIRGPQVALEVQCLIDMREFHDAERLLADPARARALDRPKSAFLRARLAFMQREFDAALRPLEQLDGMETDEIVTLRNLALTGAGRGADVRWPPPDPQDKAGPEVWLSRAVAALASLRYDDALTAASWAERLIPESLSVLLVKAQAHLEADKLEQGLGMLELVAKGARDRERPPVWLERQQAVRSHGRFAYVECEYLQLLEGSAGLERIRAVDRAETTWFQDGRLDELEAMVHRSGPEWVAAVDRSVSEYHTAGAYQAALRLAEQVFAAEPSTTRARAFGWAAYQWSFPTGGDAAAPVAPERRVERLTAAISALQQTLPHVTDDEVLESLRLLVALKVRRVELLDRGSIAAGVEASAWAFCNAIVAVDDFSTQTMLEWVLRYAFNLGPASSEIAEYAGELDASHPVVTETRLIARTNSLGVDQDTYELLATLERQYEQEPPEDPAEAASWRNGVKLRLALFSGDLPRAAELADADMGDYPWALQLQAMAAILLKGPDAAGGVVANAREILRSTRASKLTQAFMAAVSGDHDEAALLIGEARQEGNELAEDIDDQALTVDFLRRRDRPLIELADDLIARAESPAALLWADRILLPMLAVLLDEQRPALTERVDRRLAELDADRSWVDELARADTTAGALAGLWRAAVRDEPRPLLAALQQVESLDCSGPLRWAVDHALRGARGKLAADVLADTVAAIAAGREPDRDLLAEHGSTGVGRPVVALASALAGVGQLDDPPSDEELAAGVAAFLEATRRSSGDSEGIWRLQDAVEALPGKFAEAWSPGLHNGLLDELARAVGLDAEPTYEYRSHLSFVLGDAFIPEDTSSRWVLFSEYIPQLRERIRADTGYVMPGFNVRADRFGDANVVHLLLHDVILETYRLPSDGEVVRYRPPEDTGQAELRDPLSGELVWHVPPGEPGPAVPVERWLPLPFVMRHVEHFVRTYLADIVTVWDVLDLADQAGPEAAAQLEGPAVFLRWLSEARDDVVHERARDPATRGRAIAERMRRAGT